MNEHIYYHFWCLENAEIPYGKDIISDGETVYYHDRRSNDRDFIKQYRDLKSKKESLQHEQFVFDLLGFYLTINYNESNKNSNYENALIWVHHTATLLSEHKEEYLFLNDKVGKFLENFELKDKLFVKSQANNVFSNKLLGLKDKFFTNFITVNVNLTAPKNSKYSNNNEIIGLSQKVATVTILELFKHYKMGTAQNDLTKICRFISAITGNSYNSIHNDAQKGIKLKKSHDQEINDINKIFNDLNINITLNTNSKY